MRIMKCRDEHRLHQATTTIITISRYENNAQIAVTNKKKFLRIVAMWLEGGKVQGYEMSGTRGRQLFEETKLSKLPHQCCTTRVSATL